MIATPVIAQNAPLLDPAPVATNVENRARAIQCLGTAIAYEAGYEPIEGQQAVAEVILNRARGGMFPRTVCGVVFAGSQRRTGCQFSFTCDGSLRRRLPDAVMDATRLVAEAALDGRNPARVSGAAWYHADYVTPYWAPSLVRIAKIGAHIFYRAPGLGDQTVSGRYLPGVEPVIAALAASPGIAPPNSRIIAAPSPTAPFAPWGLGGIGAQR